MNDNNNMSHFSVLEERRVFWGILESRGTKRGLFLSPIDSLIVCQKFWGIDIHEEDLG